MANKTNRFLIYLLYSIITINIFFSIRIFAQEIKYFQLRDKRNPFVFYNEINEYDLYNYFYYYKVFYNDLKKITRFEYYSEDVMKFYSEYIWHNDKSCTIKFYKLKTSPATGKNFFALIYSYEVTFENELIKQYILYKADEFGSVVKIGKSVFSYPNPVTVVIENYFNNLFIGKIVVYYKENKRIQERLYDNNNKLIRINIFKNNILYKYKIYKYSPDGSLNEVKTYDNKGNLLNN